MILVDTSVWIDLLKGNDTAADRWLTSAINQGRAICICGLILTEILQGLRPGKQVREITRLFEPVIYLLTVRDSYTLAADIHRAARARGKTIRNTTDCIIAACAITNNVPLAQKDKDFVTIADLSDLELEKL